MSRLEKHPLELGLAETALRAFLPAVLCEHAHGNQRPRRAPCFDHRAVGGFIAYVLAGHRDELVAAIDAGADAGALERYLADRAPALVELVGKPATPR